MSLGRREGWQSLLRLFLVLSVCLVDTKGQSSCVQYYSPPVSSLHCMEVFTTCDYVTTPQSLSLTEAENELDIVFNQARIGVEARDISELCFHRFSLLYCHQVFSLCQENVPMQTSDGPTLSVNHYISVNSSLCVEDCEGVIGRDCSEVQWDYLTNFINQFQSNELIHLPSLQQRSDCINSSAMSSNNCTQINEGSLPTESCSPTQPSGTTTTDSPTVNNNIPSATLELIAAICLGTGIPLVTVSVLIFLVVLCVCRVKKPKRRDSLSQYRTERSGSTNPLEDAGTEFKFDAPDKVAAEEDSEAVKGGTLMMRQSAYHNALFVNTSPRSSTLVKRLASKEYVKMTPKQRLQVLEFPHSNICLLKDLWETNFGMTYQGEATGLEENIVSTTIFIKSLKERASSKVQQQFIIEMTWASSFNHPNVITLLGVCREEPLFMIYECLEYGSLKDFLQSINSAWFDFDEMLSETASTCHSTTASPLNIDDLCNISRQVADGMDYLSKKAFILKDLAARNCQVGQGLRVKIANFGLSYDQQSRDYCHLSSTKSTPLPLRWLAPETIRHSKFSVYSDIWSYGVVLWEVFTFGARPYDKLSNAQVVQSILNGKFLPQPDRCPKSVHALMLRCWSKQPSNRPWFSVISKELADMSQNISIEEKKAFGGLSTPDLRRPVNSVSDL